VCRYHFFKQPILLVSNPTWIKYVLSDASDNFEKERDPYLASIVGNGLLVSQGLPSRSPATPTTNSHFLPVVRVVSCAVVRVRALTGAFWSRQRRLMVLRRHHGGQGVVSLKC
jgi:hypothetical protein